MDAKIGSPTRAAEIRKAIGHPVIDGDGHLVEAPATILDYVKQVAGPEVAGRYNDAVRRPGFNKVRGAFWGMPSGPHSLDRATAMLPKLYAGRLEAAGIDYGVMYSTELLRLMHVRNDEMRQVGHRALNTMLADIFADVDDRLTPSAGIPMYSPEEAIAELDYAVGELGLKAATFGTEIRIAPTEMAAEAPELADRMEKIYPVALDALHDYDPVWQKCLDMGVAVACHTGDRGGMGRRSSPTNYVFNHLGCFAESGDYFARCLFMDGVTRRFPGLNFAFLEGGAGWAAQLYNDIFEHWEKRNIDVLHANLDPSQLDLELMAEMARQYGGGIITPEAVCGQPKRPGMGGILAETFEMDDFKALAIESPDEIAGLFVEPFYFGCEADDRMNSVAFDTRLNHKGAKLKAMFGSDIGHWDVMDMNACVPDAYKLVADGIMNEDDFRAFMFENPASFFTTGNPDFFKGTAIETEVAKLATG
jgi:predicted TIM-barrel fold metal-dependent hydrolase